MVGAPGSYAKVFDVLGKNNINVMMISTAASEANISMIIKRGVSWQSNQQPRNRIA